MIYTTRNEEVIEGWEARVKSVKAGYGIFIAIVISIMIAVIVIYFLRMKQIREF